MLHQPLLKSLSVFFEPYSAFNLLHAPGPRNTFPLYINNRSLHLTSHNLFLPIPHMIQDNLRRLLRTMLTSNSLHEITFRIHQIEINTVIHKVILALRHVRRRAEIHPIFLADILNLLPGACQANDVVMEFRQVFLENARGIARWIASYEDRDHRRGRGSFRGSAD